MINRIISGAVLLTILTASVWWSSPYLFVALGIVAIAIGLWEFYRLAALVDCQCYQFIGFCTAAIFVYAFTTNKLALILPTTAGFLMAMMIAAIAESPQLKQLSRILGSVAATLFGVFYVVLLAGFLIAVRMIDVPRPAHLSSKLLSIFFIIITASDSGAYFVGRSFGRHKLAPRISPGKTVEGSIGGLITALALAMVAKYTFFPEIPGWHVCLLTLMMNVVAQLGDLFESLLKRGAGAKDAASIIPGHGGLLDRLDSILFNAPLLYYYYLLSFAR